MATSLMRRNPFGAVDPTWSRMWDWFTTPTGHTPMSKLFGETNSYVPPVNIYETREEIIVAASLPGLDASKVNIEVQEEQLTLSGEQQPVLCFDETESATVHLNGIPRFGKFQFSFQLPASVDAQQAQAKYVDGVLCVRFLKSQQARPIRVPIANEAAPVRTVEAISQTPSAVEGTEAMEKPASRKNGRKAEAAS
jgi:HSP20 family protein